MKISYNWLCQYVDLLVTPEELAEALPMIGLELDNIEKLGLPSIPKLVVGEVLEKKQHPNADRLSVCLVKHSTEGSTSQIVCGAKNFKIGDKVPLALEGAELPGGFRIKESELRGVASSGMMCSAKELGLGEDHAGLMILDETLETGASMNDVMGGGDTVFELEVTSNRGDCLSQIGVAREIAAYYDIPLREHAVTRKIPCSPKASEESLIQSLEIESDLCPYYTAVSIQGVQIGESPKWLKEFLENVGLRSINNVVDITNYVLWEYGQPLHAFDASKIEGEKIVVRKATPNEKITTLEGVERELDNEMLVIADAEKPLVIAGVLGSLAAEVDNSSVDILLESAYFNPASIRKTSRKLALSTDSSHRFSRDVDPAGVKKATLRAVELILQLAGGQVSGPMIVHGEPGSEGRKIRVTEQYVEKILGFSIRKEEISDICRRLGFTADIIHEEIVVFVPSFRREVDRPIDLVEEILRIYGTERIPAKRVSFNATGEQDDPMDQKLSKIRNRLASEHFQECQNYTLRNVKDLKNWFGDENTQSLKLANPLNADQTHIRASLLPGLLGNLQFNISNGNSPKRLFEVGHVFRSQSGKIAELISVSFIMTQESLARTWLRREPIDFFSVKGFVESILSEMGIDPKRVQYLPQVTSDLWQEEHAASYGSVFREQIEVSLGLLNLKSLKNWDLKIPIFGAEIVIQPKQLLKVSSIVGFKPITTYPSVSKDLALVVDHEILSITVQKELAKICKKVTPKEFSVTGIEPFDFYQGEGLPEGKKSLAFAINFKSPDRTLKDKEVNQAFDKIQSLLADTTNYTLR